MRTLCDVLKSRPIWNELIWNEFSKKLNLSLYSRVVKYAEKLTSKIYFKYGLIDKRNNIRFAKNMILIGL